MSRWPIGIVLLLAWASPASARAGEDDASLARYDARVKPEHREHWAFRPVVRPEVPEVEDRAWCRNPIDAFVRAKLQEQGWSPAPPAEPRALVRRLYFDLIGLPPAPEEIDAFLSDPAPDAYERLVDRLLASPHLGERWGRHWLDAARFAETNGYERDAVKPQAWRYRDYVIAAMNDDKPFDRFLTEQLAGDVLEDRTVESMIAAGFLRVGPWDDEPADPKQDRFDQLDDIVRTTSEVFLGLTIGCARCHDHKFEPFTLADYYRLVAVFDPLKRPQDGRIERDLPVGTPEQLAAFADTARRLEEVQAEWSSLLTAARRGWVETIESWRRGGDARRGEPAPEADVIAALDEPVRAQLATLDEQVARLRASLAEVPRGYIWEEPQAPPPATHLLLRGQASSPGPRVEPGVPVVLASSGSGSPFSEGNRRLALARWMTDPQNPLTARVIVNRVWQRHFGVGLVRSPNDFGTMGDAPTHPELLDWLADWFVSHGWSLKALHRLIVTSNTYRMSKHIEPAYLAEDPENLLLWRFPYTRLEAEAIRDAVLAASGQLDRRMYGPSVYPEVPREALESHSDPDKIWPPFDEKAASRRTVYAMVRRSFVVPMLEVLDFCDTSQSAPQRRVTSVAPQALTMFNGAFIVSQSAHFARRVRREAGPDPAAQVDRAWRLALGRPPTPDESRTLIAFLDEARREAGGTPAEAEEAALRRLARVLFNLDEFVYTD